jgi:acyl dehydratase
MDGKGARVPDFKSIFPGDEVVRLVKPAVTKIQLVQYAGASGDFNPLHTDDETARQAGFDGVVAHGMLVMAFIAEAVTGWVPSKCFKSVNVRFKGITRPGDVITVTGKVKEKEATPAGGVVSCAVEAASQDGDVKAAGSFQVLLPLE